MKKLFYAAAALVFAVTFILPVTARADAAPIGIFGYESAYYYVVVDAPDGYLNFRYGPGLEYGVADQIYNGEILYVENTTTNYYDGLEWGEVIYDGRYGWISMSQTSIYVEPETDYYIQEEEPEEKLYGNQSGVSEWDDIVTDASYMAMDSYSYVVPGINIDSPDAAEVNSIIMEQVARVASQAIEEIKETGYTMNMISASYEWYIYDDVLSLVILTKFAGPWHEYRVYNFSLPEGQLLSDEELLEKAGFTGDEFADMAADRMKLEFWMTNNRGYSFDQKQDIYDSLLSDTVSYSNVFSSSPYINGSGHLCIIGKIYLYMMQNSYSWEDLDLEDGLDESDHFVVVDAPDNYCNLRTGAGISYDIITPIYNGTILPISDIVYNNTDGNNWGKTEYNGEKGWVALSQTSDISPY